MAVSQSFNKKLKGIFKTQDDEENELVESENKDVKAIIKVFEPRAFSESRKIVNWLKQGEAAVVTLRLVQPEEGKRIVDFLNGTLYAIEGTIQKLERGLFLCTPKDIKVEGQVSDDLVKGKFKNIDDELEKF